MEKPKVAICLFHVNGKFYIPHEYKYEGGGSYIGEAGAVVDDNDPIPLAKTLEAEISKEKPIVGLYESAPIPKSRIHEVAGFRTQGAFDRAAAFIDCAIYEAYTDFHVRRRGQDSRKDLVVHRLGSTCPQKTALWLVDNKAKYD